LLPHTPAFFSLNSLPYDYQPDFGPPIVWHRFLASLWPNDQASIDTLQELFGLLLTPDKRYQKLFMIVGPSRSGKGTIANTLEALRGREAVGRPTLADMGEPFGLADLISKPVAIIADARVETDAGYLQVLTERLLAISGEDGLAVRRKYLPDWVGALPSRFLIMANKLPTMADVSGALASRFIILQMMISFYGREDLELQVKLLPELPGILNWALDGLVRLTARGRFQQPASAAQLVENFGDLASPFRVFLRTCCVLAPEQMVKCSELYGAWVDWCRGNGHKQPGTTQDLGRDLRAVVPTIRKQQKRDPADEQRRHDYYAGVGLLPIAGNSAEDNAEP
jgi:putative DNA primase/helicase